MASNSKRDVLFPPSDWPRSGKRMSEDAYHELENLPPERKYEYLNGVVHLMSGGSIEHDRISYNVQSALDQVCRHGPCRVFGP